MLSYKDIEVIKSLILSAGDIARLHHGKNITIEIKSDNSPVTNVDKLISLRIIAALHLLTPDITIISEEEPFTSAESALSTFWLIDPIDSTKSYIRGEDTYTVNIGLIEMGVPTYGFIYQPSCKLLHYTDSAKNLVIEQDGKNVTHDIRRESSGSCKAAISSIAFCIDTKNFIKNNDVKEIINVPSSLKLCLVADGSVDMYPRFGTTMEWDIAAGHALIRAAGGDIIGWDHSPFFYGKPGFFNPSFIALNKEYLKKLTLILSNPSSI